MGKKLIIKGADFSVNGIAPVATTIKAVKTSSGSQYVHLIVPNNVTTSANYRIKFAVNQKLVDGQSVMQLGYPSTDKSCIKCGYSDGRTLFIINGKRATTPSVFIPEVGHYYDVLVNTDNTTIDGESYPNTSGTAVDAGSCNGKVQLFPSIVSQTAGDVSVSEFEVLSDDGKTTIAYYVAAKDSNNKACFWDKMTDNLIYANSGDLVAVVG